MLTKQKLQQQIMTLIVNNRPRIIMNRLFKISEKRAMLTILLGVTIFTITSCSLKPNERTQNEAFQFSGLSNNNFKQIPGDNRRPAKFFEFDHEYSQGEIHRWLHEDNSWHRNIY
jgi:hypothetical protein